jgi:hypothetical protein
MTSLPPVRSGILQHPLGDELLVYDTERDKLHLLDGTTATVLDLMSKGEAAEAIASKIEPQAGGQSGSDLLSLAIEELEKAGITEAGPSAPLVPDVTRRAMLQKLAGVGIAALIPAIITLTPNPAYAASVKTCGAACNSGVDFCSNAACPVCCGNNSHGVKDTCVTNVQCG